jgi:arylsulfatase A-like enzyme
VASTHRDRAVIGLTVAESTPVHTPLPRPPGEAPHVVVIVLDDLGFAQLGCFGSDIATPAIDALAAGGLRYNRFHVTAMCSPTRAALLTGRNHHAVGMGFLPEVPTGFPGYTGRISRSAATLPRVLRDAGYSTFAVGKWHLTPRWEHSASGPFDRWPLGMGFERYYGFLGGDTNQWAPDLVCDNGAVDPPRTPDEGYHLSEDLADRAMRLIQDQQQATPDKPFLCWFAPGAVHAPHQAPRSYIDDYRGRFDDGWEAWRAATFARQLDTGVVPAGTRLSDRPSWVPAWQDLTGDERRLYARMMEVFAGFLTHTDAQIGRLVEHLRTLGILDDTLLLLISDNGASAEGGPTGSLNEHRFTHDMVDDMSDTLARIDDLGGFRAYNHYPWGWAWAGNTPLRLWKRYAWLGGIRTPLVVHWPRRITAAGEIRGQFCHAVDLTPTVLDAVGIEPPAMVGGVDQQPIDGSSLVPTFADPVAPSPRSTQYFELLGSRAIYHDGWKATTDHVGQQITVERDRLEGSHTFADDRWHLFDLENDFAETTDLAGAEPERLAELERLWWHEAGRNQVLPLDDTFIGRAIAMEPPPYPPRRRGVYRPGGVGVAEDLLPAMGGGFDLTVDLVVPEGGGSGVLCALGDWHNGWAVYLLDGRPVVALSLFGAASRAEAPAPLRPGSHAVRLNYERSGPSAGTEHPGVGTLHLAVDDACVAETIVRHDLPFRWQIAGAGLLVGRDRGFPVDDAYRPPFPFDGTIERVTIDVPAPGRPNADAAGEVLLALHHE